MTTETTIALVVNAYWMVGITITVLFGMLAIVWKAKKEIHESIQDGLKPIWQELRSLGERITDHDMDLVKLQERYGISKSPMQPNDVGQKLLKESGFVSVYPMIKEKLFKLMDEMGTRTLYDSEKNARLALSRLENDPALDAVKEYVVNHPTEPLELVFTVASWNIREEYWHEKKKS